MLTAQEFADLHDKERGTVMKWLQKGLIPGVEKNPAPFPFTGHVYAIPPDAKPPQLKPGPRPKAESDGRKPGRPPGAGKRRGKGKKG